MLLAARSPSRVGPSPLRRGLLDAIRFGASTRSAIRGVCSNSNATRTGVSIVNTQYGEGLLVTGTWGTYNFPGNVDKVWEPTAGNYSVAVCYIQRTYGSSSLLANYLSDGWGLGQRFNAGYLRVAVSATDQLDSGTPYLSLNKLEIYGVSCGPVGGTWEAYVNGVQRLNGSFTTAPTYATNNLQCLRVGDGVQNNTSPDQIVFWAAIWGRKLTAAEWRFMYAHPMSLWEPQDPFDDLRLPMGNAGGIPLAVVQRYASLRRQ